MFPLCRPHETSSPAKNATQHRPFSTGHLWPPYPGKKGLKGQTTPSVASLEEDFEEDPEEVSGEGAYSQKPRGGDKGTRQGSCSWPGLSSSLGLGTPSLACGP